MLSTEDRLALDQALRLNGACIWCRREKAHGQECLVAKALGSCAVNTSGDPRSNSDANSL